MKLWIIACFLIGLFIAGEFAAIAMIDREKRRRW